MLLARTALRCRRANILPLCFFSFFYRRLISEVTERISTKLGYIFTNDGYLKNLVRTPRALTPPPTGWGTKNAFLDRLWTLTEHISAMEQDITNRIQICQSTGTPLHVPKFSELWSRNGLERLASFCPPPKFSHWRHCQPYRMDVI